MSAALFGVVAAASLGGGLYLLWLFARWRQLCDLFVSLGLVVLAALSILLAVQGLEALKSPLAAPLGALVPLLISLGVVKVAAPRYWKWYGVFAVVGLVVIAAFRPAVPVIHAVAGLVIFLLPIYAVLKKSRAGSLHRRRGGRRVDRSGQPGASLGDNGAAYTASGACGGSTAVDTPAHGCLLCIRLRRRG
ncbi:hypothetical protein [Pyrobaculum ferrireducens]|uniref:hypothetical protein n=1 Tax=Pyrobaculum ferrireducens TaxID=1104324 RepID=UPI001F19F9E8|nr:hypothetical protein [Pyrobaculum ferrireducens]